MYIIRKAVIDDKNVSFYRIGILGIIISVVIAIVITSILRDFCLRLVSCGFVTFTR